MVAGGKLVLSLFVVVNICVRGDQGCDGVGGRCVDYRYYRCEGLFQNGRCNGGWMRKCCMPVKTPETCGGLGGFCGWPSDHNKRIDSDGVTETLADWSSATNLPADSATCALAKDDWCVSTPHGTWSNNCSSNTFCEGGSPNWDTGGVPFLASESPGFVPSKPLGCPAYGDMAMSCFVLADKKDEALELPEPPANINTYGHAMLEDSCNMQGYDSGAGGADGSPCGYAKVVKAVGGPGYDFAQHSWMAAQGVVTEVVPNVWDMDSPADCIKLCRTTPKCSSWVFDPLAQGKGRCILKHAHDHPLTCAPLFSQQKEDIAGVPECSTHCFLDGMDTGSSENCGYSPEVKVFGSPGYNFSSHSWITSKGIPTEAVSLDSPGDCQSLCAANNPCAYFVYKPEAQPGKNRCILKGAYTDMSCPNYINHPGGIAGPANCETTCGLKNYDYGALPTVPECGYAEVVKVFGGPDFDFSKMSWIASQGVPTETTPDLNTPMDCKDLCVGNPPCAYWVYAPGSQGIGRCILKKAFAVKTCTPLYTWSVGDISGPIDCTFEDEKGSTCGDVRNRYREHGCCGTPAKMWA